MRLGCIIMASGHSKRFGRDKLTFELKNGTVAENTMDAIPKTVFNPVLVVTRSEAVAEMARQRGFIAVINNDVTDSMSVTIKLGLERLPGDAEGCMFCVCDQPYLRQESVLRLAEEFCAEPERIVALSKDGKRGSPVIFPKSLFSELMELEANASGRVVMDRHPQLVALVEAEDASELLDIDRPDDIL